ncbi:hypothetical protein H072_6154 [Dactylellina haptotyla CBS 200.50]|uniref:F-box domain-containing protein n=1 Tax=Dactylellina haptotyla (strain CBS 200.50) TaxID=1284197 RepID=S8AAT8_DACHA|nr:hypothetical protein H072_6154 [Dactylellina haptotyla CBS 200.50]
MTFNEIYGITPRRGRIGDVHNVKEFFHTGVVVFNTVHWQFNLSSLPADIIYEICERLPNKDVLKLQLVSKTMRRKLSKTRLDAIHSKKTYYLCLHSIKKLEKLIRNPEMAARVTEITFDVATPQVRLRSKRSCIGEANDYPEEARSKLQRWSSTHLRRQQCVPSERRPSVVDSEFVNYEGTVTQAFNLFKSHFATGIEESNDSENEYNIFKHITTAFRSLPNLTALEFAHTNPKMIDRTEMLQKWREYNDHMYALLYIDPKIELQTGTWPWCSWLRPKTPQFLLSTACPAILFCAAQAEKKITQVKIGDTCWGPQNFGMMASKFEPQQARLKDGTREGWEKAYYSWMCRYAEDYRATFGQLKRFELCLDPAEERQQDGDPTAPAKIRAPQISLCLLTILRNVEELKVWRLRGDTDIPSNSRDGASGFVLPTDTALPKLRSLEVGEYSGITLAGLTAFLCANSSSIRHLSCDMLAFGSQAVSKSDVLLFLKTMKDRMKFETFKTDFLVDKIGGGAESGNGRVGGGGVSHVYLSFDIKGSWGQEDCEFKFGVKKISMTGEEVPSKSYWIERRGWEEFLKYFSKFKVEGFEGR